AERPLRAQLQHPARHDGIRGRCEQFRRLSGARHRRLQCGARQCEEVDRGEWRSEKPGDRSDRLDRDDPVQRDAELRDAGAGECADLPQPAQRPRLADAHPERSLRPEPAGGESDFALSRVAQRKIDSHSRARRWASAIWLVFISRAMEARQDLASSLPFRAARLNHLWAETKSTSTPCPVEYASPRLYIASGRPFLASVSNCARASTSMHAMTRLLVARQSALGRMVAQEKLRQGYPDSP